MIKRLLQFLFFLTVCISAHGQASGLADLKFGRYQIADSQWNVSACMYTATCQIYSKNPGTAYKIPWTSGQLSWATGDYVAFVATGNSTNPWQAIQYSSNGTQKAVMGNGHIINMGTDYFFFVGSDNNTGQLFSMTSGFANTSGVTWTGTLNPTVTQVNTYASGGSTTPLAAGQTAAPAAPAFDGTLTQTNQPTGQTVTSGSSSTAGITTAEQTRVNTWNNTSKSGNLIIVEQVSGNNNNVKLEQNGDKNKMDIKLDGAGSNTLGLTQTGSTNYMKVDVNGYNNTVLSSQTTTTGSHYSETTITGNTNTVNADQSGNGNNLMFTTISGNNNSVTARQSGNGSHYLDTRLTGNGNTALVDQSGNTQNKATLDLTNGGGPATVDLQQTGGKNFTIIQTCANPAGCTTTVRQ